MTRMRTAYIANVGTRDVQTADGKPLTSPRSEGAALRASYDALRADLRAPILLPGIEHVAALAGHVDRVVLFATDQSPTTTDARYREKDTIELGHLLVRLLRDELGQRVGEIVCDPIPHNPADHDRAIPFYAGRLAELVRPEDFDAVWIAPSGGVDASNLALTLNATRAYGDRCQFIYVFPEGRVQTLGLHRDILNDRARQVAAAHRNHRDFVALREVLVRSRLDRPWVLALCAYADARLRFDFAGAEAALEEAHRAADGAQTLGRIERCRASLAPLVTAAPAPPDSSVTDAAPWDAWLGVQRASLAELYFNLRLTVERQAWVDFLGRLFRLYEAALRLLFEDATRHSTEKSGREFPDFRKAIAADADVTAYFAEKKVSPDEPTTHAFEMWLACQVKRDGARFGRVRSAFERIAKLAPLRNKSILAHGYAGVSRAGIEAVLRGPVADFVDGDLRELLTRLGAKVTDEDDPLRDVVRWLEEI